MSEPDSHQELYDSKATYFLHHKPFQPFIYPPGKAFRILQSPQIVSLPSKRSASLGQPSGVGMFGLPSLGISYASPQAIGSQRYVGKLKVTEYMADKQDHVPVTYSLGLIPLPYFGGLVVTTCEIIVLAAATKLVLWITAIYWTVHKCLLPFLYAA